MGAPYYFEDFTEGHYRFLLRLASQSYRFAAFGEFQSEDRIVLWRHDVDMSMQRAHRLAEIEAEEGIRSTYYVLFHSDFYNLLERPVSDLVRRIARLGHDIGLHFDASYYGETASEEILDARLRSEKRILEDVTGSPVASFAYHNPEVGDLFRFDRDVIGGMINVYGSTIRSRFGYCSDSNGYWRYRRLKDVLLAAADERLQVLTHPAWWQERAMSPADRVRRCIDGRAAKQIELYTRALQSQGRKHVS